MARPTPLLPAIALALAPGPTASADLDSLGLAGWTIVREDASGIEVREKTLRLRTQPDRIWAGQGARNLLLAPPVQPEPSQLSARVGLEKPTVKYEQAGLLCYVDDDRFVKFVIEHIDEEPWVVSAIERPGQRAVLSKERLSGFSADLVIETHGETVLCRYRENAESGWRFASTTDGIPATERRRFGLFTQDGPGDRVNRAAFSGISLSDAALVTSGVKRVATGCKFTEGPAISPAGDLYFSDGPNDRIVKLSRGGDQTVFLSPCGAANGLLFDAAGRLLMCQSSRENGGRALAGMELGDEVPAVLTDKFEGRRYIAPNDLCIDHRGRIFFTDPFYSGEKSQPVSGVYRRDPDGNVARVIEDLLKPNGILLTPDSKTLYVSDRGTQKLHRYRVKEDGSAIPDGILYDFSPDRGIDGMWMDELGNIYGAAGKDETTGLFVISPDGHLLLHRPMAEFSTNVVMRGQDLYLTASTSVYHMRTRFRSARLPPAGK